MLQSIHATGNLTIAFCANKAILPGLYASVASLVYACPHPEQLEIHVFSDDLTEAEMMPLRGLAGDRGRKPVLQLRQANPALFARFRSLQGDWMTYFRLMIPELLADKEFVVYLDADLVVKMNILEIRDYLPFSAPFAAVAMGPVGPALESGFFQSVGLSHTDRTLNAGVLVFNCRACREEQFLVRCLAFADRHRDKLQTADQTILIGEFSREFDELPGHYNVRLSAATPQPREGTRAIFHFVASPKPWDPGGRIIHRSYRLWRDAIRGVGFSHARWLFVMRKRILKRAWTIRRSYLRECLNRIRRRRAFAHG